MSVIEARPDIDPHPLSPYVAWAGNRNKEPILAVLRGLLPEKGDVLELASGAGLHINYFAPYFPQLTFHPSDKDVSVFDTIKGKRADAGNKNVADPVALDLTDPAELARCQERPFRRDLRHQYLPGRASLDRRRDRRTRRESSEAERLHRHLWPVQAQRQIHDAVQC